MNNLNKLIYLSGIKQEYIAKTLGVSQPTISFWKSGRKNPSIENAIALAKLFNVSVGCVVGTESVPDGYPDNYTYPAFYDEIVADQERAADEGRLMKPAKNHPFSQEQIDYLDERDDRLVERIIESLKEDTSSLKGTGTKES